RQHGGRHLVQKRLEQMVIRPIENAHSNRSSLERLRCGESTKAGADDDDMRLRHGFTLRVPFRFVAYGAPRMPFAQRRRATGDPACASAISPADFSNDLRSEAERWIERRQRSAKEDATLNPGQERRPREDWKQLLHQRSHQRAAAPLAEENTLRSDLTTIQRPHIGLADLLHDAEILAPDWAVSEARIQLLSGNGRGGNCDVDPDRPHRAHCMSGIANQEETVTRPVVDHADGALEREEWSEVFETICERPEDGVELAHPLGDDVDAFTAPFFPFPGRQCDPRLNMVRVLGQQKTPDLRSKRNVERVVPASWLFDREPDQIQVVVLVFWLEPALLHHGRVPPISSDDDVGADFEGFIAVTHTTDADCAPV